MPFTADGKQFPPGLIGVLSTDLSRWNWANQSLVALEVPAGSQIVWCVGEWISVALNRLVNAMRPTDQWLLIAPDDHVYESDLLVRLLAHDLPLVAPLCALRRLPYPPSMFHDNGEEFTSFTWKELQGKHGLCPCDTFGGAFALVRREVLEAVGMPFYENMPGSREAPQEDLYAFRKARLAGYPPMIDLDLRIGHCLPAAVFPEQVDSGDYGVRLWSFETLGMVFPTEAIDAETRYHAYT